MTQPQGLRVKRAQTTMRKSGSVAAFRKNRDQQNVRVMGRYAVAHKKGAAVGSSFLAGTSA
ncbi:hypothetical protein C1N60_13735 [Pantoea sp. SGAir0184]